MSKREKIIAVLMGILVLVLIYDQVSGPNKKSQEAKGGTASSQAKKDQAEDTASKPERIAGRLTQGTQGEQTASSRDPFMKADPKKNAPAESEPVLILKGIMWDGTQSMAMINDEILKAGDTIEGHRILEISKSEVRLKKDGRNVSLQLFMEAPEQ